MANHTWLQTQLGRQRNRSQGDHYNRLIQISKACSRITTDDTSGVFSDGASFSSTTYDVDMTVIDALVGGLFATIALLSDVDLLLHLNATDSLGATPAAVAALSEMYCHPIITIVNDAVVLIPVFGLEVLTTTGATKLTSTEIRNALRLKKIANHKDTGMGIEIGEFLIARDAGTTMTQVYADPATDDVVESKRQAGALFTQT